MKFCLRGADQGWMAHLADLHMKRGQQRGKSAAKTVKWGMEKAAESQEVHATWSQQRVFRFTRGKFSRFSIQLRASEEMSESGAADA